MTYPSWTLLLLFPTACSCAAKIIDPESLFILPSFNRKRFYSLASLSPLFRNWPCNPLFFSCAFFHPFLLLSNVLTSLPSSHPFPKLLLTVMIHCHLHMKQIQNFTSQLSNYMSFSVLFCYTVTHTSPAGIYLFNVNARNTKTMCKIKLTIKTPEKCQWYVFTVNFEQISYTVSVSIFALNIKMLAGPLWCLVNWWILLYLQTSSQIISETNNLKSFVISHMITTASNFRNLLGSLQISICYQKFWGIRNMNNDIIFALS